MTHDVPTIEDKACIVKGIAVVAHQPHWSMSHHITQHGIHEVCGTPVDVATPISCNGGM